MNKCKNYSIAPVIRCATLSGLLFHADHLFATWLDNSIYVVIASCIRDRQRERCVYAGSVKFQFSATDNIKRVYKLPVYFQFYSPFVYPALRYYLENYPGFISRLFINEFKKLNGL